MKIVGKSVLAGIAVAILGFFFASAFSGFFNGLSQEAGISLGIGLFISMTVVVCTGIILSRINKGG